MSVITVQQYKEFQGKNSPTEDVKLTYLVNYVNSFIERYCNTKFQPTAVVDQKLTTTVSEITIPQAPLISVESLALVDASGNETVVTDFYTELELGIITLGTNISIPVNNNNVKVSYTYGYSSVPDGLVVPAIEFVTYLIKREFIKGKNTSAGESVSYLDPSVIPVQVRAGLDLYRML